MPIAPGWRAWQSYPVNPASSFSLVTGLGARDGGAPVPHAWDLETDVIVIGFGAAGACAALEAAAAGAEVIVLDRFSGGGATALSGGVVYAGGGTRQQAEAGVDDTPEDMFRYLSTEVGDAVAPATLRDFCATSPAMLEWLSAKG